MLDSRALVNGRQKRAAEVSFALGRKDRDVRRQLLVFGAQAVRQPRTHRRNGVEQIACVELSDRHRMIRAVGLNCPQNTQFVRMPGGVRQHVTHVEAAFSLVLKPGNRSQQSRVIQADGRFRLRQLIRETDEKLAAYLIGRQLKSLNIFHLF